MTLFSVSFSSPGSYEEAVNHGGMGFVPGTKGTRLDFTSRTRFHSYARSTKELDDRQGAVDGT